MFDLVKKNTYLSNSESEAIKAMTFEFNKIKSNIEKGLPKQKLNKSKISRSIGKSASFISKNETLLKKFNELSKSLDTQKIRHELNDKEKIQNSKKIQSKKKEELLTINKELSKRVKELEEKILSNQLKEVIRSGLPDSLSNLERKISILESEVASLKEERANLINLNRKLLHSVKK